MANYQTLKAAINAVIKANGNKEITGTVLNEVLLAMVNSLGAGYQFAGVAKPSTNPGTPDQKVFYIASQAGTYTNFGGAVVSDGIAVFEWDGSWTVETLDLSMAGQVQSDWTETDTTKKSYIKHKPNIPPSANVDPVPTEDSPNAVSSGGTYDMIVNTAATLFGDIQDATNVNAIESEDGKIYNDYQAGDIFFIVDDNVRKYRVALVAGTADAEHPVTISPVNFYYALNSADAINLSLTLKTVSTEQQSLSTQQKAQARTNIAAVSYEQQSLNADQKVQAQNNVMGKAYSSTASDHSGLGKVYLQKNNGSLTQAMINTANTVYVIQYDYTLAANITIPAGCTLVFDGGSISGNYTITLSDTLFTGDVRLKKGLKLAGTLANEEAYSDWYEIVKDGTVSWTDELNCLIDVCSGCLMFGNGTYLITGTYNGNQHDARFRPNGLHVKSNISYIGAENTIVKQDYSAFFLFTTGFRFIYSTDYLKNNVVSVENVTFKNITFQGAYEAFEEYSHLLSIESVDGLLVEDCKFLNWRGDAICVGWNTAITEEVVNAISKNVTVRDCVFDASSNTAGTRNGISIVGTTSENITIKDNSFSNLGKDDMPGAIDIEQEGMSGSTITLKNVNIQNNTFTNITNGNGVIALQKAIEKSGVRITENTFNICNQYSVIGATHCKDIVVRRNTITGTSGNVASGIYINNFDDCIIDSNILKFDGQVKTPTGWQFIGNNDSVLKITGNQLVNIRRSGLDGLAGFIRLNNIGFLTAVNNLFWNCGKQTLNSELLDMSVFWFNSSEDTGGIISNNLYSNSTGTTTNVNMVINKPDGVTLDAGTNIIKSIE